MSAASGALAQVSETSAVSSLEEVVVTARRREELLQDVPVAVTAMTPERLQDAQVTTARQLVAMVPGLNINTGNQRDFQRYTIRGQGVTLGAGEGVTVYVAEAPIPQFVAGGPGFYFDLENLQVLNGPQGTLFGRNTTGGAVLFTPKKPAFENGGFVQVGLGNYDNRDLTAALNWEAVPDKLAIRIAGEARQRDGYTRNIADGAKFDDINYTSYRISVTWRPTDQIENYLLSFYNRSTTKGTGFVITDVNPAGIAFPGYGAILTAGLAAQRQRSVRVTDSEAPHWWFTKNFSVINTTSVELGESLRLKNIASFTRSRISGGFDIDGTQAAFGAIYRREPYASNASGVGQSRNDYLTEELQLSGEAFDKNLTWVFGGFYSHTYPYGYQQTDQISFGNRNITSAFEKTNTTALFAQGTLDMGPIRLNICNKD